MLLINPTFKIENPDIIRDKKGRFLLVRASLRDEEFCFANIYAPNDPSLQKTFFNELSNKLQPHSNDNLILGGDFISFTLRMIQVSKKPFLMNCLINCNLTQMTISSLVAISTARLKVLIRREEKI